MAKFLYSVTMSLDGFISGHDGDMTWMTPYIGANPTVDAFADQIGALLVGRGTFSGNDPNAGTEEEGAMSGTWSGPQIVLTHRPPAAAGPEVSFVTDFDDAVSAAAAAAGDQYVNVLGADIARQCLEACVLDEILTCIAPVMIGDGTRLFSIPGGSDVKLERTRITHAEVATNLWFRVHKQCSRRDRQLSGNPYRSPLTSPGTRPR